MRQYTEQEFIELTESTPEVQVRSLRFLPGPKTVTREGVYVKFMRGLVGYTIFVGLNQNGDMIYEEVS